MKERPILMSTENVKAILEGRKAQTRRLNRLKEINQDPNNRNLEWFNPNTGIATFARGDIVDGAVEVTEIKVKCPYGQVGDRLWVRETFLITSDTNKVLYRASDNLERHEGVWRPSIHMPRWASRITLEITEIRVERVQEITPHDCVAEGIAEEYGDGLALRDKFEVLWDSINAKRGYPWESNPWVWVISFKVI